MVSGLGGGDKYDDESLDLFQYFNSTCYSGFGDDDKVSIVPNNALFLFEMFQPSKCITSCRNFLVTF